MSVFVPTFNQEAFVEEAIRSAAEQEFEELEVVVGDDGSADETPGIVEKLAEEYGDRVRAFTWRQNVGITENCNRLLERCRGSLIAFHAGDDVFVPGKIPAQVAWFDADPGRVLCGHDVEVIDGSTGRSLGLFSSYSALRSGHGPSELVRHRGVFAGVSVMIRRSSLPRRGFDSRLKMASDVKLWVEALTGGGSFGYVNGVLARYRRHEQSASQAMFEECSQELLWSLALVAEEFPDLRRAVRAGQARLLDELGWRLLRRGDRSGARRMFLRALGCGADGRSQWPTVTWGLLRASLRLRSYLAAGEHQSSPFGERSSEDGARGPGGRREPGVLARDLDASGPELTSTASGVSAAHRDGGEDARGRSRRGWKPSRSRV